MKYPPSNVNIPFVVYLFLLMCVCKIHSGPWLYAENNKEFSPDFYPIYKADDVNADHLEEIDPSSYSEYKNLENRAQDFVLELKQIEIPGYPHSLNPSIIRWKGQLLLIFRIRHPKTKVPNQMGLVWLNDNFEQISDPYVLQIPPTEIPTLSMEQDPRLITMGDRLLVVYSNILPGINVKHVRRVFIAEIHFDGQKFYTDTPDCLSNFEGENEKRWEKNWTPFIYKDNLLLSYSLTPHRIFRYAGNSQCETVCSTLGLIHWDWGVLRGGSHAELVDGQYLSFFHSCKDMKTVHSKGKHLVHYFFGAYTFSSEPPFAITSISSEPIFGENFYSPPEYKTWKPLLVVFPGGFIFDENYFWVVYGRQDHELWVAKLDRKGLMNSLVPVKTVLKPK